MNAKLILLAGACLLLAACDPPTEPRATTKDTQAAKAATTANSLNFTENSEIDNIARRLKLTVNPGQLGYVLLMNEAGQPIMYTSVKGKITSGTKRLTSQQAIKCLPYPGSDNCQYETVDAPSDEGTYGASGEYVFFWTMEGQYIQWNGKYLYSDKPFRTNVQPLVIENRAAS